MGGEAETEIGTEIVDKGIAGVKETLTKKMATAAARTPKRV